MLYKNRRGGETRKTNIRRKDLLVEILTTIQVIGKLPLNFILLCVISAGKPPDHPSATPLATGFQLQ